MCELAAVGATDSVLDVGAGSGYQTAVLSRLASTVLAIEIVPSLAERARAALAELGCDNVEVRVGDGGHGAAERGPFQAILVAAAASSAPRPLLEQLASGGRLVLPVGTPWAQELVCVLRRGDQFETERHGGVRFVAFVGDYGQR
jgi:protein-L-isoaspartate(D-aspartate) O-methyltransferase